MYLTEPVKEPTVLTDRQTDHELTGYPSIDKPWLKYFKRELIDEPIPKRTVYQSIYENNKAFLTDDAINYFGNKISYGKLFSCVDICTRSLLKIGISRGNCVTLCTAGVPEAIYIVLSCSRIGAIANFINPLFSEDQIIDRINETEAEWIFVLDEMYSFIRGALERTCVGNIVIIPATNSIPLPLSKVLYLRSKARIILKETHEKKYFSYSDFTKLGADYNGKLDFPYQEDTPTVMVYSSGTTGASKGILLTNDSINAIIQNYKRDTFYGKRTDTFLSMIPVWFSTGIVLSLIMPLAHGVCVIPEPKFSKESFARDLKKYKPTLTLTATSLWLYVATAEETKDIDLSNMTYPSTGGEKISEKDEHMLNEFLEEHGCKVELLKGYGMCELGSEVTGTTAADGYKSKIGSVGYPILNSIVSAFNIDTDEELKYGERGEIRVCSPAHMKGYYKNPEATKKFFKEDKNGNIWGCTGDIGYVDEDGEVFICGRATDSATLKTAERIYLFDIEDVIFEDESVAQCKVVDINTPDGTELAAHIVFKEGTDDLDTALHRIHNLLLAKLPASQVPKYYKSRSSMPVHSNGKRDVEALRKETDGFIVYQ